MPVTRVQLDILREDTKDGLYEAHLVVHRDEIKDIGEAVLGRVAAGGRQLPQRNLDLDRVSTS